uniref:Uncharacterized protein n=1 Tax=Arundo donax TaxID=35708 RepID=A0A0A9ETQ3_ARUDO
MNFNDALFLIYLAEPDYRFCCQSDNSHYKGQIAVYCWLPVSTTALNSEPDVGD